MPDFLEKSWIGREKTRNEFISTRYFLIFLIFSATTHVTFDSISTDDRPLDEERKSVRFDLEKEINIKFTYSESEEDWESESEDKNPRISAVISNKLTGSILSSHKSFSQDLEDENDVDDDNDDDDDDEEEDKDDHSDEKDRDRANMEINRRRLSLEKLESVSKNAKIVGRRFLVQNVSENEHLSQMTKNNLEKDSSLDCLPNKLGEKVKNIDLMSKSETDCSTIKSSDSEEIRRARSIIEKAKQVANRLSNRQVNEDGSSEVSRVGQSYAQKERFVWPKLEYSRSIDDMKMKLNREHEKEIEALKIELEVKLQERKKELEDNFTQQKILIQQFLDQKLEEAKEEMTQKVPAIALGCRSMRTWITNSDLRKNSRIGIALCRCTFGVVLKIYFSPYSKYEIWKSSVFNGENIPSRDLSARSLR